MSTNTPHGTIDTNPVTQLASILRVPPQQAAFVLAALASNGRILLVDEACRETLPLVSFFSRLTGREFQPRHCSSQTTFSDFEAEKPLFLDRMEALSAETQTRLAERLLFEDRKTMVIGTVNSRAEAEGLSEELRSAIGAVIDLSPVPKEQLEEVLNPAPSIPKDSPDLARSWQQLSSASSAKDEQDFVKAVAVLADWIGKVETSAVLSRPPIDALRNQVKTLSCLKTISSACGIEEMRPFEQLKEIHASLLAHRLHRLESGGRTNVGIVHAALEEASKELLLASKSAKPSRVKEESLSAAWDIYSKIYAYLTKKVIGREDGPDGDGPPLGEGQKGLGTINLMLTALFSEGHILFEDFPGTGKSYMVEMLSDCISDDVVEVGINIVSYKRIQCVPDLMPSDITGYEALVGNRMVFRPGPVFAYFLLLDEINRTTPKVQAALLEAMAEKRVSVGNHRYNLGAVFFVLASQNPLDAVGTYPLPAAQLDRFLFKRRLEPVSQEAVDRIIRNEKVLDEGPRIPVSQLRAAIKTVGEHVDSNWQEILPLLRCIRETVKELETKGELEAGSTPSPRSMQKLGRALQSLAFVKGGKERDPSKAKVHRGLVREIALDYFGHRIFPSEELQNQWSQEAAQSKGGKRTSIEQLRREYILRIITEAEATAQKTV